MKSTIALLRQFLLLFFGCVWRKGYGNCSLWGITPELACRGKEPQAEILVTKIKSKREECVQDHATLDGNKHGEYL